MCRYCLNVLCNCCGVIVFLLVFRYVFIIVLLIFIIWLRMCWCVLVSEEKLVVFLWWKNVLSMCVLLLVGRFIGRYLGLNVLCSLFIRVGSCVFLLLMWLIISM